MTTATYLKEIRYCRASRDYDASLDGEYIGSFATYHDAEVALDQLVSDLLMGAACSGADVEVLDTVAEQAAVTVELPGLIEHIIPICADSTVELVQRDTETNDYMALLVDGRHYDLVMCKHTVGRGAIASALLTALATVEQAIAELAAPRWQLCSSCGDMVSRAPICAACVESGEAIVAPKLLAEADACLSKADEEHRIAAITSAHAIRTIADDLDDLHEYDRRTIKLAAAQLKVHAADIERWLTLAKFGEREEHTP